jgi:hypothetical protein
MSELKKSEEKAPEAELGSQISEEQLEQVAGGVPKGEPKMYLQYTLTEARIGSISPADPGK